ncbi:MAG: ABC-F family ATP-binding cassette domain-containing protein [Clostridiales bacterium]|nr:ABC-F family ATP-binding cassette domain-containing protein [Clostridiales bacterium]
MLLQCKNLEKHIGTDVILRDVTFILEEKEKAALIGVNGAGKTSVFRLLTGEWQPDGGTLTLRSDARIGYMQQLEGFNKNAESAAAETGSAQAAAGSPDSASPCQPVSPLTLYAELDSVFEPLKRLEAEIRNLESEMGALSGAAQEQALEKYARLSHQFEEQGGYEQASRVRGVLKGLGFPEEEWDKPLRNFSGGQRTRAALGRLLLTSPDLLLLDEPTNHLDIESVAWLEDYLRGYGGAIIIISHDRYFLDRVVTKTIEVENKKTAVYNGNYTFFAKQKAADREIALKHYLQNQKEIKHHQEVAKTLRSFKTEMAIIRAKSREKLLDKIERVEKPDSLPANMRLILTPKISSGHDVLTVENLRIGYGKKVLSENISFEMKKGDRTALIGPNGIGKTTLFKILVGELAPLSGKVREGVHVRVGYYDQEMQLRSDEDKTVFQELADTYPKLTQTEIRNVLAAFVFTGDDVFKPVSALSGGERGRVSLAKIMLGGANFLILDEPTNHLDMFSKEILEEALRDFPGTVLYISHDRYFINNTATRVLELTPEGLTAYLGNYDYYIEKKKELKNPLPQAVAGGDTAVQKLSDKDEYLRKKETESEARKQKTRLARLEAEIASAETRTAEIDGLLSRDEYACDARAAAELYAEKTALEEKLLGLYAEWEGCHD